MYAVAIQLGCPEPPRSPMIVGSALDAIVRSRADSRSPSRIVVNTMFRRARDIGLG
ncbi:hypothetical protein ACFXDH_38025 [Streptomyces sp. NPDC059467]|uniref:hypothetical protein n=1 Tax=Streptomyces sp. NPDC059467 TaxID=3346844 RepID=UPI00369DA713